MARAATNTCFRAPTPTRRRLPNEAPSSLNSANCSAFANSVKMGRMHFWIDTEICVASSANYPPEHRLTSTEACADTSATTSMNSRRSSRRILTGNWNESKAECAIIRCRRVALFRWNDFRVMPTVDLRRRSAYPICSARMDGMWRWIQIPRSGTCQRCAKNSRPAQLTARSTFIRQAVLRPSPSLEAPSGGRRSTATRAANSPASPSPMCSRRRAFASRWTARAAGWCGWRIANQPRNPLRLSSLVILGVVARMSRCATRSSYWFT